MATSLPADPSPDRLKRDARRFSRAARAGDRDAVAFIERWHPKPTAAAAQGFPLHAAQLAVARSYGFSGWPALAAYLRRAAELGRSPLQDEEGLEPADRFCALACLRYDARDEPPRREAAGELLAGRPDIVDATIWAAAAAGDAAAVRRQLSADPRAANATGGPHRWPPLLYLAFSRCVPDPDAAPAAARHLLDAGADPNAGYLWRGLVPPFTALTGVFGGGEQGPNRQPAHPVSHALARLLLERGADPNDGQALYNRMFTSADDHLELLLEFGLGRGDGGPWRHRLGDAMDAPEHLVRRQLDRAIDHQLTERVRLLVRAGIDLVTPSPDGFTPRDRAHRLDYFPVIHELVLGQTCPSMPGGGEAGLAAAILLSGPGQDRYARAWLAGHPEAVRAAGRRFPLLAGSAIARHHGALDRLAWAGFDLSPAVSSPEPEPPRQAAVHGGPDDGEPVQGDAGMLRAENDQQAGRAAGRGRRELPHRIRRPRAPREG